MDLKVQKPQAPAVDEWGDLKTAPKAPAAVKKPVPAEPEEDDWGTYETPVINKNKTSSEVAQIAPKRKEEDEEDEWGDVVQAKAETGGGYYDCATGTQVVHQPSTPGVMNGDKCFPLFIGGSSLAHGMCEGSMNPKSCSSLRCFNCDKKVQRFINARWHESVDYLFVRNHNTNLEQLEKGLMYEPGWSSYACQCQFLSVDKTDASKAETMKWMCGGHEKIKNW